MGMEFSIRRMGEADLAAVAEIEAGVFTDWYRVHRRDPEPLSERTLDELRYATSITPDANLVAVSAEGALVGFVLARLWGSVGWFGTFGVPTQFQGLGIGKALVSYTMEHLRDRATTVGLETMPESGANMGLYARSGLVVSFPTLILEYALLREAGNLGQAGPGETVAWSAQDTGSRTRLAAGVREIGDAILCGLDYTAEVEAIESHGLGETFFSFSDGAVDGFAILRTVPFRNHDTSGRGYVHAMALRPGADQAAALTSLLRQMLQRAASVGLTRVVTGLSARYPDALDLLLRRGFRVVRAAIRMVDRDSPPEIFRASSATELSRWAG
ncbi:MAG: GNAT family N-acetyltransferase [Candidatus Eisenbacteria bacterium]